MQKLRPVKSASLGWTGPRQQGFVKLPGDLSGRPGLATTAVTRYASCVLLGIFPGKFVLQSICLPCTCMCAHTYVFVSVLHRAVIMWRQQGLSHWKYIWGTFVLIAISKLFYRLWQYSIIKKSCLMSLQRIIHLNLHKLYNNKKSSSILLWLELIIPAWNPWLYYPNLFFYKKQYNLSKVRFYLSFTFQLQCIFNITLY